MHDIIVCILIFFCFTNTQPLVELLKLSYRLAIVLNLHYYTYAILKRIRNCSKIASVLLVL